MKQNFFRFDSFEETKYWFSGREISCTFKIYILHSNALQTRYIFDFCQLLSSQNQKVLDRTLRIIFLLFLRKRHIRLYHRKKYNEGKTRNIIFLVNEKWQFKFLENKMENLRRYGLNHFISETFYSISWKINKRLNEIYSTWYHLPKNTLLNGHLILIIFQSTDHIDQRSVRLFYCRFGEGDQNLDDIFVPREEIEIFNRNSTINRIFFERESDIWYKFFRTKKKI